MVHQTHNAMRIERGRERFEGRSCNLVSAPVLSNSETSISICSAADLFEAVQIFAAKDRNSHSAGKLEARTQEMEWQLYQRARQLHSTNEQLRATERRLDAIFQQAAVGMCQLDLQHRFVLVNDRYCEIAGWSREQLIGMPMSEVIHPEDRDRVRAIFDEMLRAGDNCVMEKRYVRASGEIVWVYNSASLVRDDRGDPQLIVDVSQDITARKSAEAAQRRLERRVITAQEEERLRIARELHDQMSQHLAGMLLALESLKGEKSSTSEQIEQIQDLVQQMGHEVHRVAWELRPTALDDLGLFESLRQCIDEWSSRSGIPIDFHCDVPESTRVPGEVETICYRVLQESLTNVLKHARATAASVVVKQVGQELRLICEDNGIGFDDSEGRVADSSRQHLGIRGMRERLSLVGGELHVESSPGSGASLFIHIPLG